MARRDVRKGATHNSSRRRRRQGRRRRGVVAARRSEEATVIDPVGLDRNHAGEAKQASVDDAFSEAVQLLKEPFAYPPSSKQKALLEDATCVVAMHPDEATEPAVCAAASLGLPFRRRSLLYFCLEVSAPPPVLEVRPRASEARRQGLGHFLCLSS